VCHLSCTSTFLLGTTTSPSNRSSGVGPRPTQIVTTFTSSMVPNSPRAGPVKRCRVAVPTPHLRFQPFDQLLNTAGMLALEPATYHNSAEGFGHVQP
jgi:hypothetical protein